MPEGFMIEFTIAGVEELVLNPAPATSDALAGVMVVRSQDGEHLTIGLTLAALEQLTTALIENSPRTPGTPGRN